MDSLIAGADQIHGVSHDGHRVCVATGAKLIALYPASGQPTRTLTGAILRTIESSRFVTGVTWTGRCAVVGQSQRDLHEVRGRPRDRGVLGHRTRDRRTVMNDGRKRGFSRMRVIPNERPFVRESKRASSNLERRDVPGSPDGAPSVAATPRTTRSTP